ncbi:MAG: tripartite tricarboxylate transporter substrate binding protein, partial [Betaproteobacteria bacterium]|nr:tripartite tricarboxylate transporter substrate binding protein [Betaproteobacteria bacterium]
GFEVAGWYGVLAPAGTPRDVIALLNAEIVKVLNHADVRERAAAEGALTAGSTPDAFGAYIKTEIAKWDAVIKASGATAD